MKSVCAVRYFILHRVVEESVAACVYEFRCASCARSRAHIQSQRAQKRTETDSRQR